MLNQCCYLVFIHLGSIRKSFLVCRAFIIILLQHRPRSLLFMNHKNLEEQLTINTNDCHWNIWGCEGIKIEIQLKHEHIIPMTLGSKSQQCSFIISAQASSIHLGYQTLKWGLTLDFLPTMRTLILFYLQIFMYDNGK